MTFRALRTIALRELKVNLRNKANLVSSISRPIIWYLIFGSGFGAARFAGLNMDYREFLFPGVVAMSLLFTSMRSGISVIWDREFGFMKEILVSPSSRLNITAGKIAGTAVSAVLEGAIILVLGLLLGAHVNTISFTLSLAIMFLTSISLVSIGLIISSFMRSFEGFQTLMTFLVMPMFFLSGAIFPLGQIPSWMKPLTTVNPLTYGVDALRIILTGAGHNNLLTDLAALITAATLTTLAGTRAFKTEE
ncbi:MAG: ABC transporter permease subunit [Candidatus Altiarchaeales archaeon]|nr:ABC transporter permease subunit [Candidatus Altiarchaeales archaeon]MBD3416478.1 ABC transporter permease subunit [Candidatus Altiarchaeales archaeon]